MTRFVIALTLGCLAAACRPSAPAQSPEDDPLTGGVEIFADDFETPGLSNQWLTTYDGWHVEEGWVHVAGAHNAPLFLSVPLPAQVRVEFKAKALSAEGDLKFEIFTDGQAHESGYIGIFGGWDNRLNVIARLDEHGDDRLVGAEDIQVEQGRVYSFAVVRTDNRLRWYVDGEHFMTYDDAEPLSGEGHAFFAFNDWEAPVAFDDVCVYDLGEP